MHEYTVCTWHLAVVLAMYTSVSKFVTTELFPLQDDESARTPGVLGIDEWEKQLNKRHTEGWSMWLKWQLRDGCFWSRQSYSSL